MALRAFIATLTLVLMMNVGLSARKSLSDRVLESIVGIMFTDAEAKPHFCTGFVVAQGILTAQHCNGNNLLVDGVEAHVIKVDSTMLLLRAPTKKPAIAIRTKPLHISDRVFSFGFAYGDMEVLGRTISRIWLNGLVSLDGPLGPGMSGGPTVDRDGRVVGLNQATNELTGILSGQTDLTTFVRSR